MAAFCRCQWLNLPVPDVRKRLQQLCKGRLRSLTDTSATLAIPTLRQVAGGLTNAHSARAIHFNGGGFAHAVRTQYPQGQAQENHWKIGKSCEKAK